jgi:hypothetical protein
MFCPEYNIRFYKAGVVRWKIPFTITGSATCAAVESIRFLLKKEAVISPLPQPKQ